MDVIANYREVESRLYAERIKKGKTLSHEIYKEWYLSLAMSPLADIAQDEGYRDYLHDTFESCRKFIDHLDSFQSGNASIVYLQNIGKILAEEQKEQKALHPAFLPFLDTVETLRRLSYIVMGPNVTDGKLPFRHPALWNFCTVNMSAVNKMTYIEHFEQCQQVHEATGKEEGTLLLPSAEEMSNALAFLKGPLLSFMYDNFLACGLRGVQTVLLFPMFTTEPGKAIFPSEQPAEADPVPIKEGLLLTPEECYSKELRKQYIKELEHLERKRNENAFLLLEQAEQTSLDVDHTELFNAEIPGTYYPELIIFYKILQKALPQEYLQEQLKNQMSTESDILQSLFPDTYFIPSAETKSVRNMSITKATKRIVRGYETVNISGQTLKIKNDEGETIQEVAFSDGAGNPSDQIINSFDISIMDCVGSLQQKNPNRNFFTDVEIAKEFNSTDDKKGNITPDSPIVLDVRESMKRLNSVFGKIDITEQIANEMKQRNPDKKKIKRLESGKERLSVMQALVKIDAMGVHEYGKDKKGICYVIKTPPPFYLHGALSHQMIQIPFNQLNTPNNKKTLTKEIRLLREYTRRNIETHISMIKNGKRAETVKFNKILDDTFRTSKDKAEKVEDLEITQVVKNIPEWKRYKLQTHILDYVQELTEIHKVFYGFEVVKKKLPGKSKVVAYGFKIILEDPQVKKKVFSQKRSKCSYPETRKDLP